MVRLRDWFGDGSVPILDVPLACCAMETQQAASGLIFGEDIPEHGTSVVALSGIITHNLAPSTIDWARCMYCGVCIEPCPTEAPLWRPGQVPAAARLVDHLHGRGQLGHCSGDA